MGKRSFGEDMVGAWKLLSLRDKILGIAQMSLSILVLVTLLLDYLGKFNRAISMPVELVLVIMLLLVNAVRSYPKRKRYIVVDLICIVVAVFCLVMNFVG